MTDFGDDMRGTANRGTLGKPQFSFNPFPEQDYIELLIGCIRKILPLRNHDIQAKARAQVNVKFSSPTSAVVPPSHEWSDLNKRLLFLRYFAEGMSDGNSSEDELIQFIMQLEIDYERNSNSHRSVYQELTAKLYGYKFRAPDPPPAEKEPELDEDTKAIIEKNKVNEKLQLYLQSLSRGPAQSDKAFSTLVLAYVDTVSDLSVPLHMEYDDQQARAEDHNWIEWMQANDFPGQYEKLFPVLYDLLNQARAFLKSGQIDDALHSLEVAQILYDRLATLLHDYYAGKVRKGTRVVVVLMVLKSISRMIVSVVVFKNVKGLVSQFAALIAVNLVYQKLDQSIGARDRGLSVGDAVKDAALELLTVKITAKVSQVLAVRFKIDPKSLSLDVMSSITGAVIGSMEEEFMKLGRGVTFVGFLKNLRAKFISPEFWIENIVIVVLARGYTTKGSVSLPVSKGFAQAATLATVLTFSPKASANTVSSKPAIVDVAPQNAPADAAAVKTAVPVAGVRTTSPPSVQGVAAPSLNNTALAQGVPTPQQRAVANVTLSPSTDAGSPTGSPLTPLSSLGLLGMAVVISKNSRRGKILRLFEDAKRLLNKIDDPETRKKCEARLNELRKEYDRSNDHTETRKRIQAIRNKINEIFAEEQINFLLEHNMPSFGIRRIISKVAVPRRGDKGPEIIDMVYKVETKDGRIVFLLIESKYGRSTLGWVWYGKTQVRQFSPEWFKMRIEEIRLQKPGFAAELANAWKKGGILPFVMKIAADGSPKAFVDFTVEWTKYMQRAKKKP